MEMVDKLTKLLKDKHGKDLNIKDDVYYLFLDGGLFTLYYDQDEKTIKVNVEFLPEENTFVYFTDTKLEEVMGE